MNYQLTGITKRSKFIYYHVCYIYPDGRTKYLEMRRERTDKEKLYLKCCRRTKCTATLSILKNTVFRSIYNFKVDQNKRMMCATRKKKRNGKTIEKFNRIKDILSDFDTLSPDEHISSLCTTLERLGSL